METYKKPVITSEDSGTGLFPVILGAVAAGFGMALAKGKTKIDSSHTQALTSRKTTHD